MAAPLPGANIRASDIFNLASFTPTWTSLTIGTGAVNEGWYSQIGDLVFWGFRTQLGTSPSFTGTALVDLPVAAWVGGGNGLQMVLGAFHYRRASGTLMYTGSATVFASAGTQAAFSLGSTTTRVGSTGPTPAAAGVDDVLSASGVYRAQ